MSQSFKIAPDLLDAKSQLASDHEWLWKITIRLRQSDEIIETDGLAARSPESYSTDCIIKAF
jgi:hypothetical protein